MASMDRIADSAVGVRTTGTIPISVMKERICWAVTFLNYQARNTSNIALFVA